MLDEVELQYIIRIDLPTGTFRCWTGAGDITLNDRLYLGGAGILSVDFQGQDNNPRLNFILADKRHTQALRKPVGAAKVKMQIVGTLDNGANWQPLEFTLRGRLSRPTFTGLNYSVEVAPDVFYPTVRMWTEEDHNQRLDKPGDTDSYRTDSVFSQQRYLAEGKIQDDFGHIPPYEPGNYERNDETTPTEIDDDDDPELSESRAAFLMSGLVLAKEAISGPSGIVPQRGGF